MLVVVLVLEKGVWAKVAGLSSFTFFSESGGSYQ